MQEISQEMSALLLKVTHAMCTVQLEDSGDAAVRSMQVAQLGVNFHSHVSLADTPIAAPETTGNLHAKLDQIMVKSAGAAQQHLFSQFCLNRRVWPEALSRKRYSFRCVQKF